jgi:hypothetical protein
MKICKNDSDIILYPVTKCSQCAIKTQIGLCKWFKIVGTHNSMDCGGIKTDILSDIFKL